MRLATTDTPPSLDLTPRTHTPQTFCVWQHAVPLLESHTVIFPDETRCFDSLAEMYRLVGGFGGLWVCVCPPGGALLRQPGRDVPPGGRVAGAVGGFSWVALPVLPFSLPSPQLHEGDAQP